MKETNVCEPWGNQVCFSGVRQRESDKVSFSQDKWTEATSTRTLVFLFVCLFFKWGFCCLSWISTISRAVERAEAAGSDVSKCCLIRKLQTPQFCCTCTKTRAKKNMIHSVTSKKIWRKTPLMLQVNAEIKFIRKLICGLDQKLTRPQKVVKKYLLALVHRTWELKKRSHVVASQVFWNGHDSQLFLIK